MSTIAVERNAEMNEAMSQARTNKKDSQQDRAQVSQGTYLQELARHGAIEVHDAKARLGRSYTTGHALSTIAPRKIPVERCVVAA
jgi:hypothetical protein